MSSSGSLDGGRSSAPSFRWQYYDPALLRLFPFSYLVHLAEEWLTAAPVALWSVRADPPLPMTLLAANAVGLVAMTLGVWIASRAPRYRWIAPAVATAVLLNTVGHAAATVMLREYSAGLISAVVLWVPIGVLTWLRCLLQASARVHAAGLAVGMLIEGVVVFTLSTNR